MELYNSFMTAAGNFQEKSAELNGNTVVLQGNLPRTLTPDSNSIQSAQESILGSKVINDRTIPPLVEQMLIHLDTLLEYLKLCSTPAGFKQAWDCKTDILSLNQIESIKSKGGNFFLQHDKVKFCRLYDPKGVVLTDNKNLVFGLRSTDSEFKDKINDLGIVEYFPPKDLTGALRFKWMQELCNALQIPMIVLIIKWYKCNLHQSQQRRENHLFCIAAAKIVHYEDDIKDYVTSISKPLSLQLINPLEAQELILSIKNLSLPFYSSTTRTNLDPELVKEWSYTNIANKPKGLKLKKWAKDNKICCPGCGIPLNDFNDSELSFCHFLSQNYCKSLPNLSNDVHHPDNLYLGCQSCNSSQGEEIPTGITRKNIEANGRIGDWIRKDLKGIKSK